MATAVRTWDDVPFAVRDALAAVKRAAVETDPAGFAGIPGLTHLADLLGWRAGPLNAHWGGPRPLTSALVGAGLGALAGRTAGSLAEHFAPEGTFEPGAPKRKWGWLGAALGATSGLVQGVDNAGMGQPPWAPWPPPLPTEKAAAAPGAELFEPVIHRDRLAIALLTDPTTPPSLRAATAGLVEAAAAVRGSPVVSPWDVARVAIATGSGAASGIIVGKLLGALAGLSRQQQKHLQDAGYWTGLLRTAVPPALGLPAL